MQGYKRAEIKAIVGMHAKQGYTTPRTASTGAAPSNALADSPADQSINDQAGQRAADVLRLGGLSADEVTSRSHCSQYSR